MLKQDVSEAKFNLQSLASYQADILIMIDDKRNVIVSDIVSTEINNVSPVLCWSDFTVSYSD